MRIIVGYIIITCLIAGCGGSTLVAKGTLPKPAPDDGIIALFVESSARINRAEFVGEDGSFSVMSIAQGSTLQLHTVPSGDYCLSMVEWGMGGAGAVLNLEEGTYCFTVANQETTYPGHLVVQVREGRGITSPVDLGVDHRPEEARAELESQYPGLLTSFSMKGSPQGAYLILLSPKRTELALVSSRIRRV